MPDQAIHKIMTATEPADVATMAMIECLRQIADGNKKLNTVLEGMQAEVRDVRERLIRIEASEFKTELSAAKREIERLRKEDLNKLDLRIDALELRNAEQTGGVKTADAVAKYGPLLLAIIGVVFIVMVATGRIVL